MLVVSPGDLCEVREKVCSPRRESAPFSLSTSATLGNGQGFTVGFTLARKAKSVVNLIQVFQIFVFSQGKEFQEDKSSKVRTTFIRKY